MGAAAEREEAVSFAVILFVFARRNDPVLQKSEKIEN
jgi:hypothetical protein